MSRVDFDAANVFFENDISFDFEKERDSFIDHMEKLQSLSVEEATLYKKWQQIKEFNSTRYIVKASIVRQKLWTPRDITNVEMTMEDIDNLYPEIVLVDSSGLLEEDWFYLRHFIHTFEFNQNVGRLIKILIRDKMTDKYLGIASLGSDVTSMAARDNWIGWNKEDKFDKKKLNNTSIATTIVSTQPFGYNFLGGKLIASMLCTDVIRNSWKEKFGDDLVGLTTTSLYGKHSMYQRIPFWKELGLSKGKMSIKPDEYYYRLWLDWVRETLPEDYERSTVPQMGSVYKNGKGWVWDMDGEVWGKFDSWDSMNTVLTKKKYSIHSDNRVYDLRGRDKPPPTGPKNRIMNIIYKNLGISQSKYAHGFQRGVYFAPFYENTREFLRGEINSSDLILSNKLTNDLDDVINWWKPKAIRRYNNLISQDRIKPNKLYYRDMIQMETWEEVKDSYLNEVGR